MESSSSDVMANELYFDIVKERDRTPVTLLRSLSY